MSDPDVSNRRIEELVRERDALRHENASLNAAFKNARQAFDALAGGEVDAVVRDAGAPPILLRESQRALRASEQLTRAIFNGALDAMLLTDDRGVYVDANPAACELFGLARERLVGRGAAEFTAPDADGAPCCAGRPPGSTRGQLSLVRADGARRCVEFSTTANIRPGLHLSVLRDVTERRSAEAALQRTEERLREVQKMEAIGRLAGGIAHDFNNMLTVILSYTTFLLEEVSPHDPLRADLEEVRRAGERAAGLTRQLLAFSRRQVLQPRVIDLHGVVLGMEKMLRRALGEDVELLLLTGPRPGRVLADPGQIEQVIMNLAFNARDAMPGGGRLTIETGDAELDAPDAAQMGVAPGEYVVVSVADTGHGMTRETQARIFEPFFTTKERGRGTGLGLATVLGIVQQSGGNIQVASEPGRGTAFTIYLPRTSRAPSANTSPPPSMRPLRGTETVLLVEDEEQVRTLVRAVLRRSGYHVLEAQNGGEALLACEQHPRPIHLLLTDVVMPRMSGRQLAERLAAMQPAMRVLYMSGYTDDAILHHGVHEAGVDYLQKPITPDALLRKVREVLDAP